MLAIAALGFIFTSVAVVNIVRQTGREPVFLPSDTRTDTGRTDDIRSDDIRSDDTRINDRTDIAQLRLVRSLNELSQVWSVATYVREDGRMMVVGGNAEGGIKIWDGPVNKLVRVLIGHTDVVRTVAVAASGERLLSGSGDGIKVWKPQTGELLYSLSTEVGSPVWTVAISLDERTFVSGDYSGTITAWDLKSGKALYRRDVGVPVWSIAIAPDGESFVSGDDTGTVTQWNLATGDKIKEFTGHRSTVRAVAITPDGKTLASSSVDRTLKAWNLPTQQLVKTLNTNSNWVLTVAFDPVEQTLIRGGKDQDVKVWK